MPAKHRFTVSAAAFHTGYSDLKPGPVPVLDALAAQAADSDQQLHVEGHTADDASTVYNNEMSLRRAEAVKCYLAGKGIPVARITTTGAGAGKPLAANASAAGRELNRRVEITLSD